MRHPFRRAARRRRLAVALVAGCWLGTGAATASAAPATGSVTIVGQTGSYVSGGDSYLFDSASGSLSLHGGYLNGPNVATVDVSGNGSNFTLSFAAPTGQTLQPGGYVHAARYPFETAAQAGIDVSGDGRGCNEESGSFDVRDVHVDLSGNVDRLWLVYEVGCGPGSASVFGEVRLNEPPSGPSPILGAELGTVAGNRYRPPDTRRPAADLRRFGRTDGLLGRAHRPRGVGLLGSSRPLQRPDARRERLVRGVRPV